MLVALSSICDRIPILTIQFVKGKDPLLGSAIASSLLINQTITQTQDLLFFHVLVTGNLPVSHQYLSSCKRRVASLGFWFGVFEQEIFCQHKIGIFVGLVGLFWIMHDIAAPST